ncbi:MAG: hypothetical protein ABS942_11150 [Solibacillus sp.]
MTYLIDINGLGYGKIISNLTVATSADNSVAQIDFELLYREKEYAKAGDVVTVYKDKKRLYTAKVIEVDKVSNKRRKITAMDYGFYFNNNEVIIQFKKVPAEQALKKLLEKFGVNPLFLTALPQKINKVYKGDTVSDVIKDILNTCTSVTGRRYYFEMRDTQLVIGMLRDNVYTKGIDLFINPSAKHSISTLRNKVTVVSEDSDKLQVFHTTEDAASIKKFGMLQKVEQIKAENKAQAKKIAQETLKKLNKVQVSGSVETVSTDLELRANKVIELKEPNTGLSGTFVIKSCTHALTKLDGLHSVKLEVEPL